MHLLQRLAKVMLILGGGLGLWLGALELAQAQSGQRCFAETGYCISGRAKCGKAAAAP